MRNVFFVNQLDFSLIPSIYELSDVLLLSLSKNEIFVKTIPSKLQSYLVAGKPIIASLDGEACKIIKNAKCWLTSKAENSIALKKNILKLKNTSLEKRDQMGKNGRDYFKNHFDLSNQVKKLEDILIKLIGIK